MNNGKISLPTTTSRVAMHVRKVVKQRTFSSTGHTKEMCECDKRYFHLTYNFTVLFVAVCNSPTVRTSLKLDIDLR